MESQAQNLKRKTLIDNFGQEENKINKIYLQHVASKNHVDVELPISAARQNIDGSVS